MVFLLVIALICIGQVSSLVSLHKSVYRSNFKLNLENQVQVEFLPTGKTIMADIGAQLSDVAEAAKVDIKYDCRKGECGTCQVQVNGKWIKTCQTKVPSLPKGVNYAVTVKVRKNAEFFSPKSFVEGFTNNALGVVGLIVEGSKSDNEFQERMERERKLAEKVDAIKRAKAEATKK